VNSTTKKILAIIASGMAVPALALAEPGGGGAAIGPVNGSGVQGPQATSSAQKAATQGTNFGSIPPNAQSGMSSGFSAKQNTNASSSGVNTSANLKTKTSSKSLNRTTRTKTGTTDNMSTSNSGGQR